MQSDQPSTVAGRAAAWVGSSIMLCACRRYVSLPCKYMPGSLVTSITSADGVAWSWCDRCCDHHFPIYTIQYYNHDVSIPREFPGTVPRCYHLSAPIKSRPPSTILSWKPVIIYRRDAGRTRDCLLYTSPSPRD